MTTETATRQVNEAYERIIPEDMKSLETSVLARKALKTLSSAMDMDAISRKEITSWQPVSYKMHLDLGH